MKDSRVEASRSLHAGFDYRRLASPCADGETPRAVVVLYDERDGPILRGLEALRVLSVQGTIKPLLVACATESGLTMTRLADGVSTADDLFDALHRVGRIDRLDIVTVFSETLDDHAGSDLAEVASELVRLSRRLAGAGRLSVRPPRLGQLIRLAGYGRLQRHPGYESRRHCRGSSASVGHRAAPRRVRHRRVLPACRGGDYVALRAVGDRGRRRSRADPRYGLRNRVSAHSAGEVLRADRTAGASVAGGGHAAG